MKSLKFRLQFKKVLNSKEEESIMIKKFLSIMIVFMMIISMSAFIVNAYTVSNSDKDTVTKSIKALSNNTLICDTVTKKFSNSRKYSAIKPQSNEISKMNIWVMNIDKKWMSEKVSVTCNNTIQYIDYYKDVTFTNGATVCFWGEQSGGSKRALTADVYAC